MTMSAESTPKPEETHTKPNLVHSVARIGLPAAAAETMLKQLSQEQKNQLLSAKDPIELAGRWNKFKRYLAEKQASTKQQAK